MGSKITIDSSTLMNKGLEVIEAHFLFGIPLDNIEVVIHPQSIIHSFVEYIDGSILAQMSEPNMMIPIQYALTYPERRKSPVEPFVFTKHTSLQFFPPDRKKFRCLDLAFRALSQGGSAPCYLNAANEVLVDRFCQRDIAWHEIGEKLEALLRRHTVQHPLDLDSLLKIDAAAREEARTE
jgi:1-deoxy-D-xylulose-5-phosphate reductoisomerase